jgi:predicted permease
MHALRGGDDPHARRRLMKVLLAGQVAFCILVQFVAGLFVSTFQHLANRSLGFSPEHLLTIYAEAGKSRSPQFWMETADTIRATPGVESVALAGWPLLEQSSWRVAVRLPGHPVELRSPYALDVSPGYFRTMRIGLIDGREFRPGDLTPRQDNSKQPSPGVGIVNEAFARIYFNGQNPVGRLVHVLHEKDISSSVEIIGYVRNAVYRVLREPMQPIIYFPQTERETNALMVRTVGDELAVAPIVKRVISNLRSEVRMHDVQPQNNFLHWQMLRERLLAALSLFFAVIALVLAAVGLYGVLNYSVTWQQREIGIRIALGARAGQVVRRVIAGLAGTISVGLVLGLAGGIVCGRFVESLLFEVKTTDANSVVTPILILLGTALLAALPPSIRAVRIDPAQTLRSE